MSTIIQFPTKLKVDEPTKVSARMDLLGSFIIAMGSTVDPLQIRGYIHERQGKLFEHWTNESVEHLGHDVVIEMLESMLLHLKKDKRDA